jgi:hypothetical protein
MYLDAANRKSYPGSGTTWNDLSGNGNHATLYSSPTYSNDYGGNFNWNGSNQYATASMVNLRPTTQITQETWFTTDSPTTSQVYIGSQYGTSSGNSYALWKTNNILNSGVNTGGSFIARSVSFNFQVGVWYYFVATYDGSTEVMYLNGQVIGSWNRTGTLTYNSNNTLLAIAGDWNGSGYDAGMGLTVDGNMPVVRIYNKALTASEIQQSYNALKGRFGL